MIQKRSNSTKSSSIKIISKEAFITQIIAWLQITGMLSYMDDFCGASGSFMKIENISPHSL